MTFPSSTGATKSLDDAWRNATNTAAAIKQRAQAIVTQSAAGNVGASQIMDMLVFFADAKVILQTSAAVPGIAAYAQTQSGNANIAAEFSAMTTQLDATRDWVINNFPKDGSGFLLERTLAADGRWVDRQFSAATLAPFRTVLNALIATID